MSERWSESNVVSIADDVRGQIAADPDGASGNSPERVKKTVRNAGIQLWDLADWNWARIQATLTTVADTATVEAPDDFRKLDTKWMRENEATNALRFFTDARQYQSLADRFSSASTGPPRYALVETDDSASVYEYRFRLSPTPDAVYNYPYWYVKRDPWTHPTASERLLDTESPVWPGGMDEGWRLLATAKAYHQFLPGSDRALKINRAFKNWANNAIGEVQDTITGGDSDDRIVDGYDDVGHFMSNAFFSFDDELLARLVQ